MIVGGYSLHLYCDAKKSMNCSSKRYKGEPAEFTGESGGEARKAARKAGWYVFGKYKKCVCPDCKAYSGRPK